MTPGAGIQRKILRAMPTDAAEVVLHFLGGECRLVTGWRDRLAAARMKLSPRGGVTWKEVGFRSATQLYAESSPIPADQLKSQGFTLGSVNCAPTSQDAKHHVYWVTLRPYSDTQIMIGESIRGGSAEGGGASMYSFDQLMQLPGWKDHFALAGCEWAIAIIDDCVGDADRASSDIISEFCRRAWNQRRPRPVARYVKNLPRKKKGG